MPKKAVKRNLGKSPKIKPNWDSAIEYAEKLIGEIDDDRRKYRLRLAIKWFKFLKEIGEPWPGKERKRRSKR